MKLKKYISLSKQAENTNLYKTYKELIEIIRNMTYPELHAILSDTEVVLTILCRGEAKGEDVGLEVECQRIQKLLDIYLKRKEEKEEAYLQYTYEFIEKEQQK